MFCTLFLSAPAFAQTAQPVIQTAQAVQNDVTIAEGTTQEFDAAQGEIKFDGTLTNKGTIIIKSSNPAQTEAILRAAKVDNQGKIVSEVTTLTIYTEKVYGAGEVTAPENIAIAAADKDLLIANGTYRAKYFRPSAERKLAINARRIDAQVDLKAYELSIGVREGNLDIIKQKVDGDPIYYNRGGDITAVMPGNGFDIYVLAAGNITLSGVNAIGLNGEVRDFVASAGLHFAVNSNDGNSEFACGGFAGVSCAQTIQNNSGPGQIFEPAPGGPFEPSGTITINGAIAKDIFLGARDIVINGTLDARQDNRPGGPSIILQAANSITVSAPLKTEATTDQLKEGIVALVAPTINVTAKITSDAVNIEAFENEVATTGSIITGAIEARTYININGGHIIFEEAGGALLPSLLPHDSGEFTIKTGKLTAHRYVKLAATGNIDAGNIEVLPYEAEVPLGTHDVRIHANVGKEDAPPLKIGGGTNGAASISLHGTTDLGEGLTQKTGVIFLTNGPSGDIVIDGAKLNVTSEHDGTPSLIAYAGTGQVTVKGNIVLDGTSSAPAGQVLLVGDEIRSTGATISVKDTLATAAEKPAKVVLATSKLTLAGDLAIEANSKAQTSVRVVPKGSITLDPQEHFDGLYIFVDKFPVNVAEDEVLVNGSGNLTVKSKSDEAKVEITAKPLKFNGTGTGQIFATGTSSQINVDYPGSPTAQNSLIFNGGGVTFDTSNPNGDAGDINILADKVRNAADAVVELKANAESNGKGGNITFIFDSGRLVLDNIAGGMSLSANSADGDGGVITVENENNGRVEITDDAVTQPVVTATGSGDGKGGRFRVKKITSFNPTTSLDVYELIKVDGGQNLAQTDFDGEISLNGVTCQQWRLGSAWPRSYWDCANPSADRASVPNNAILGDFADSRVPALKAQLGNSNTNTVRLYLFDSRTALNTFFHDQVTGNIGGATSRSPNNKHIYVSVFLKIGQSTRTAKQIGEASAHEIGHAIDIVSNYPSAPSLNAAYSTYIQNDFLYLDYTFVGLSDASSVRRDPCLPDLTSGVSGPFLGINDPTTNAPFCDPNTFQIEPQYAGWLNSRIAQHVSPPAIFSLDEANAELSYPGGWAEIHSQVYAYRNYDVLNQVSPGQSNLRTANSILANGTFACAQAWSIAENSGIATPPSPTPSSGPSQNSRFCDQVIPGWYSPGQ